MHIESITWKNGISADSEDVEDVDERGRRS